MTVRQIAGRHRTVASLLRAVAQADPDAEAYVEMEESGVPGVVGAGSDGRRRLTFGGWDQASDAVASLLAELGVRRGDAVCLMLPPSIEYAVCYQAAARLGAVTSGVNLRLGHDEQRSILSRLAPAVTVADTAQMDIEALGVHAGRALAREELATAVHAGGRPPPVPEGHDDDPVCVVWTSGSTGVPKGALFDHRNLRAVAEGTDVLSRPGDRRLSPLPFAHVGYMTRPWDEITRRITTVITPSPWTARSALELMESERVTVGQGVPTQWALVLRHPGFEDADLSALRVAGTGAARVPAALVREMRRRLGCPVVVRYTSTETSLGTSTQPDDPDDVVCTSVGRPVAGVELTVTDDESSPVPPGAVGRVRLRSAAVMRGYVRRGVRIDLDATSAVLSADGWLTTGDLGRIGPDGNLRLVGRVSEMYIRGGYNVYPAEVEAVLRTHTQVAEAAVVGTDDPVLGEVGVAFVVPAPGGGGAPPTLEELRRWCHRHLADYKAPDRLVIVDRLPLTAMGKTDIRALHQEAATAVTPVSAATKGG